MLTKYPSPKELAIYTFDVPLYVFCTVPWVQLLCLDSQYVLACSASNFPSRDTMQYHHLDQLVMDGHGPLVYHRRKQIAG